MISNLSDSDLMDMVCPGASAVLDRFGSLRSASSASAVEFKRIEGIGGRRALALEAVFEIGRRVASEPDAKRAHIRSPEDAVRLVAPHMRDLDHEQFRVLLMNMAGRVIGNHIISIGGIASSIVEPRSVFKRAILESAASIICVHNHPSGNLEPSAEDVAVTKQLVESGVLVGIPVRDHIIIAGNDFTSLSRRGLV